MRIQEVEITNFLAIGEAKFNLDTQGLVHISGTNKDETSADSNGAGKSSVGDAISWALWGTTAREVSGDDVVNTKAGKNCRVTITLDDDGDLWQVRRHRKYTKLRNALQLFRWDGKEWQDKTKGTSALTQAAIERLMGCSEQVFNSAVYFGQENIPDIPNMSDIVLKKLVEQAAGVDVLTTAYQIARDRLRERAETTAEAQFALDRAEQRHTDAVSSLARLRQQHAQWGNEHAAKLKRLKTDTVSAAEEYKSAKSSVNPLEEAEVRKGIAECDAKIASVNSEREREEVLAGDFDKAKSTLSRLESSEAVADRNTKSANRDLQERKKELDQAKNASTPKCPSCKQDLTPAHREKIVKQAGAKVVEAENLLREAAAVQADVRRKIKAQRALVEKAGKALKDYREGMTDVSSEGDRLRNLRRELHVIEATKTEVERIRQRAQRIAEQYKNERAATNPFDDLIAENDKDVITRAEQVDEAKKAKAAAKEEEAYAQAVVDVYAPNGVRAHRLDEATPFLNERTAHYLGSLADGAIEAFWTTVSENKSKTKLVDKFSVTVEKEGSAPRFKALSGGEKRKVRLACALALQDLVASRASKSIEIWLGDEIDDALDDAGLERLMGILEQKARERGTVLVISHNDIAHYARKTMTVTKSGDRSTVTLN